MNRKKKKILIYAPLALWRFHVATDAEIAQRSLDRGDEVYWIACNTNLPVCQANLENYKSICMACMHRSKEAINWLASEDLHVLSLDNLSESQRDRVDALRNDNWEDLETVKRFSIDDSDIGMGVVSSLVSQFREPEPDLGDKSDIVLEHVQAAAIVHYAMRSYINDISPDEIYLFNGRFSVSRPALRAAQSSHAKVVTHERSTMQGKYLLTDDDYPHALDLGKRSILNQWNNSKEDLKKKIALAKTWYESQRSGKDLGWFSFVKQQERDRLPEGFDYGCVNIAIFVTSEDEFAVQSGWENIIYANQNDGIEHIVDSFKGDENFHVYIRMHPNMAGIDNSQTQSVYRLPERSDMVTVIDSASTIDTYALIKAVDIVVTFGTTVGIEAVYMGKPSILLGRAFFEDLGGVIKPKSHAEAVDTIRGIVKDGYRAQDNENQGVYIYGYYMMTAGEEFKYVLQNDVGITGLMGKKKNCYFKVSWPARIVWVLERGLRMLGMQNVIKKGV